MKAVVRDGLFFALERAFRGKDVELGFVLGVIDGLEAGGMVKAL